VSKKSARASRGSATSVAARAAGEGLEPFHDESNVNPALASSGLVPLDELPASSRTALPPDTSGSAPRNAGLIGNLVPLDEPRAERVASEWENLPVTIRSAEKILFSFSSPLSADQAIYWSQVICNRHRWQGADDEVRLPSRSRDFFTAIGLSADNLRAIAEAGVVEVSIPFQKNSRSDARIFPWEAMLSAATEGMRNRRPLIVVRHLVVDHAPATPPWTEKPAHEKPDALFVQSLPAGLESWDFEREQFRVVVNLPDYRVIRVTDPTLEQLIEQIADHCPELVHFAGFDTWQGAWLLGLPYSAKRSDGLLLKKMDGGIDEVGVGRMLSGMDAAAHRPRLVALNVYNSASRLAPAIVAAGVDAVIGFQDVIDDEQAERFFEQFYRSLSEIERSSKKLDSTGILHAFIEAQRLFQHGSSDSCGTGVVLWRVESIAGDESAFRAGRADLKGHQITASGVAVGPVESSANLPVPMSTISPRLETGPLAAWPFQHHGIEPLAQLNYSMLHNRGGLFDKFILHRDTDRQEAVDDVTIRVELVLGSSGPCSWEGRFAIAERQVLSLARKIRLPLISDLQRSLRHTVQTNLMVKIEHKGECRYQETFPVQLLAIDEWRDDGGARDLLPSFVLPDDPAVPPTINAAQRYLRTLLDTAETGFTGYQNSLDGPRPEQVKCGEKVIDPQVRALWAALSQDNEIRYVNQPPTYTFSSQRIRTPSAVISERHGTCIDLAVLLAACLEYVDICAVLFLLRGHAMTGYWRTQSAREHFVVSGLARSMSSGRYLPGGTSAGGTGAGWSFDPSYSAVIREMIEDGELVPVETTFLAKGRGFAAACDAGRDRLLKQESPLDALLDVRSARRFSITPLPITKEGGR
jgi:CHAT domain